MMTQERHTSNSNNNNSNSNNNSHSSNGQNTATHVNNNGNNTGGKFGWMRRLMNRSSSSRHHGSSQAHHQQVQLQQQQHHQTQTVPQEYDEYDGYNEDYEYDNNSNTTTDDSLNGSNNTGRDTNNRVQILENNEPRSTTSSSAGGGATGGGAGQNLDGESFKTMDETKRRSNSNFTVPSVSRTSITTVSPSIQSDAASTNTIPNYLNPNLQQIQNQGSNNPQDNASVITIASSSKHQNRRNSFDTNASTMAIAPESILTRNDSSDSLPVSKSVTSSTRHRSIHAPSIDGETGSVKSQDVLSSKTNDTTE